MNEINCYLIQDIMPIYIEDEVSEKTKKIIEEHFSQCNECRQLYENLKKKAFEDINIKEKEVSNEKRFILKVKKTVITISIVLIIIIATTNVLSYGVGRLRGMFNERFKFAVEDDMFIEVNSEKFMEGKSIVLDKVLLDNSITSLIIKSYYDLDKFDSITLKDDKGNYYGKVFTFLNSIPAKYQKEDGITVLNFKAVNEGVKTLTLEMFKWKPHPSRKVSFEINIDGKGPFENSAEYSEVFNGNIEGVDLDIDRIVCGLSQSKIYYTFDYEKTPFDGINHGWSYNDIINNKGKMIVKDTTGNKIPVLSIEDITYLKDMEQGIKKRRYRDFEAILNPIPEGSRKLRIRFDELYGYYNLKNREFTIDFKNKENIEIDKKYQVNNMLLTVQSAKLNNDMIELKYKVEDSNGKIINDYILDARIRHCNDKYAVPKEGKFTKINGTNTVLLTANDETKYVISLSKLGVELKSNEFEIELND